MEKCMQQSMLLTSHCPLITVKELCNALNVTCPKQIYILQYEPAHEYNLFGSLF